MFQRQCLRRLDWPRRLEERGVRDPEGRRALTRVAAGMGVVAGERKGYRYMVY